MTLRKVSKNNRAFKGVWIPAKYWLDPDLTMIEVATIAEIDSLDNEDGCFASNKHFSDFLGVTTGRASQIINGLKEKGYITIDYDKKGKQTIKRKIRVVNKLNTPLVNKLNRGIKNIKGGYLENCKDSNTSKSNTNNSNTNSASHSNAQPLSQLEEEFEEVWSKYPNKKGKKQAFNHYKAWRKSSTKHTNEYLLKKLDEYIRYVEQRRRTGFPSLSFMNGSTWFNGRFDDELEVDNPTPANKYEQEGYYDDYKDFVRDDGKGDNLLDGVSDDELPF
ncbi:helix-turn-helix domain-containing protein [Limosilactobacillus reuteri]|uniref:helix-turn-helix domain-containing protein n=1 Tax=Limosilactobacillus reuteri TaxID=1598 RepID=UPI001E3DC3C2|nr:helix-turn-helix domain-containing protein [Limosilactobacillus reuteri]MCC4501074.1 helix-turn-helix domain-containing protein [Limosilactobacillus reuteri]MCC4505295.1 helix-turn-helix domain-containing protein [Limosilactobacillus reuteri]MCC4506457.1 helix-turn-helix domain-containing protein [Limosilactobacillus reuteri]